MDVHFLIDQETEKQELGDSYSFYVPISSDLIPPATTYFLKVPQPHTLPASKNISLYIEKEHKIGQGSRGGVGIWEELREGKEYDQNTLYEKN